MFLGRVIKVDNVVVNSECLCLMLAIDYNLE